MALDLEHPLGSLISADYNPRKITPNDFKALRLSLKTLGTVKPIIVRGNTIVAGHQRTKALLANGETHAPVFSLSKDTTVYDEIRFNQLHNGTDLDGSARINTSGRLPLGWITIPASEFEADGRQPYAPIRYSISILVASYGPWGSCVATESGEVIHAAQYAIACSHMGTPVLTYVIPDRDRSKFASRLSRSYGVYSYDHIERETYVQSFAQPYRLRGNEKYSLKSDLYEKEVIPRLKENKHLKVLDFGSGQGDYAALLRKQGYSVDDLEFFRRKKGEGGNVIAVSKVNRMIDSVLDFVRGGGRYDLVVCDYVINSVDSTAAETSVMACLNMFCKMGGTVLFSGRRPRSEAANTKHAPKELREVVYFVDDLGFTASYRHGSWFFQKFHDSQQVKHLAAAHGLNILRQTKNSSTNVNWQAYCTKNREVSDEVCAGALEFEFSLPLGGGRAYDRSADALKAFGLTLVAEKE